MRCMSFALTVAAVQAGRKDVTRRLGWRHLKPGDVFDGVKRYRGVPKADRESLGHFRAVKVSRQRLDRITKREVEREGFAHLRPAEFVAVFCQAMGCQPDATVTRIEFEPVYRASFKAAHGDPHGEIR